MKWQYNFEYSFKNEFIEGLGMDGLINGFSLNAVYDWAYVNIPPYYLIILTTIAVILVSYRTEGFYKKAIINMFMESRISASIRTTLFLGSVFVITLSRQSLLESELPLVELLFSVFASAALIAFFTPTFKNNLKKSDLIGEWEYTPNPAIAISTSPDDKWGQHPGITRRVTIGFQNGKFTIKGILEDQNQSEVYFKVDEVIDSGFGLDKGHLIYHYTSPSHVNELKRGYVVLSWDRTDICTPVEKMTGRFYNDTDQTMGQLIWTKRSTSCSIGKGLKSAA
ncbi:MULTISPECIES: hypothetical protein [Vibrio]|uniref:hypothetical protein n=1 Tax=Vibrio TaxID=662 RepID=UPI0010703E03|nr:MULTISPECIES: hypothetical protein [Vibrio]